MKTEVISFRLPVSPSENVALKERLKDKGIVTELRVRFYPGVEKSLQVSPFILHKESRREDLFTFVQGTEKYITGDNDYLIFPCSVEFDYDDEMQVNVFNNGLYEYSLSVDVIVSYMGV